MFKVKTMSAKTANILWCVITAVLLPGRSGEYLLGIEPIFPGMILSILLFLFFAARNRTRN